VLTFLSVIIWEVRRSHPRFAEGMFDRLAARTHLSGLWASLHGLENGFVLPAWDPPSIGIGPARSLFPSAPSGHFVLYARKSASCTVERGNLSGTNDLPPFVSHV